MPPPRASANLHVALCLALGLPPSCTDAALIREVERLRRENTALLAREAGRTTS